MIKGLLQKNPDLRLSAEDLLRHPWFSDMKKTKEEKLKKEEEEKEKEKEETNDDWVKSEKDEALSIPSIEVEEEKQEKQEEEKQDKEITENTVEKIVEEPK